MSPFAYRLREWVRPCMAASLTVLLLAGCGSPPLATPQASPAIPAATATPVLALKTATATTDMVSPGASAGTPTPTQPAPVTATQKPQVTPTTPAVTPTSSFQPATAAPTARPQVRRMGSPEYGMQAFLWWRPEVATRDLGLIEDAGFGWAKQDFAWKDIEGAGKGVFDWSYTDLIVKHTADAGLSLLVRLDRPPAWSGAKGDGPPTNLADFGDFAYQVASRYRGGIRAYQIWNEPNLAREWGGPPSAKGYAALLKVAYQRIKSADPDALVISAGLSPTGTQPPEAIPDDAYLKELYEAGAANYFDVLGLNAPGFKAPPEMSPDEVMANQEVYGHGRWFCFRHVEDLRKIMVQQGDQDKQVAILEFGWTTDPRLDSPYNWHAVDERTQAEYLVRAYRYAKEHWSPWIGLMSLIYIANPDWTEQTEQYWWCVTWPGYPKAVLRPAYDALKAMPK